MKNSIFIQPAVAAIMVAIVLSCNSPADKLSKAEVNVTEAQENLDKATEAYLTDVENYRNETAGKIAANNKSIEEFKARIENEKKEARADYKKKIVELEQKNTDIKKKMDDYKADSKEEWEKFKTEFNHDMEELGNAFKDLTVKNTK